MRNELKKLTTKELIELVKTFEHYPAVTPKDGKKYILSYLEDEACTISRKEIAEYLLKSGVEITQENIHLYYEFMDIESVYKLGSSSLMLSKIHDKRLLQIIDLLKIDIKELSANNKNCIHAYYFGVKDNLKPIDEYVSQIKESEAYKSYIANSAKDL